MNKMANRLTPLGLVLKWLIVPVTVGAIGYYLVGPRVESKVTPEMIEKVRGATGTKPPDEEAPREEAKRTFIAPEVDVSVTALNNREAKPKRKRRRRTTPKPVESAPEPPVAPPPTADGA